MTQEATTAPTWATQWILPTLPDKAAVKEVDFARKFTRITAVACEEWPDAHQPWLTIGPQHFRVGCIMETREEAEFVCWMLAKAMRNAIDSLKEGTPIDGPGIA
jgi:hypothetical protein